MQHFPITHVTIFYLQGSRIRTGTSDRFLLAREQDCELVQVTISYLQESRTGI